MTAEVDIVIDKTVSTVGEAHLYRMVTAEHICPFGLKAKDLLERKGYAVQDHLLTNRAEQNTFKQKYDVQTTPQIFIGDKRIGGYDDTRRYFGRKVADPNAETYTPIIAIFASTALIAIATHFAIFGNLLSFRLVELFIAISMCVLGIQKLRDLSNFSNGFLGYDLLAQRHVRYAYVYPFVETGGGILMIAGGVWGLIAAPFTLFIASIGAWSVFRAVYIEKRSIKCACVGGGSNVPLGFVSLTENLMMIAIALWMIAKAFL